MAALQRAVAGRDDDDVAGRSARHWVSTCRGWSRYFSTKHSPRPNAAIASRVADSNSSGTSSRVRATLRPRPPPPKAALMATGRPCSSTNSSTSEASATGFSVPGASGAPDLLGHVAGRHLVAEPLDGLGGRADPDQAGVDDGARELGVLGEEAVAGVHGVGAGAAGDREQLVDHEVGLGAGGAVEGVRLVGELDVPRVAVLVGVDGDGADAGVAGGADDADGDLSTVGDEDLGDARHSPQAYWAAGARLWVASTKKPETLRASTMDVARSGRRLRSRRPVRRRRAPHVSAGSRVTATRRRAPRTSSRSVEQREPDDRRAGRPRRAG